MWLKDQGGFTFSLWLACPAEAVVGDDDSTTARYRRIFAWHEIDADLRVLPGIFPAYGGMR